MACFFVCFRLEAQRTAVSRVLRRSRKQHPPAHALPPPSRTRQTIIENIGKAVEPTPSSWVFKEEMAYCRRMLDRGPAFRARSYTWSALEAPAAAPAAAEVPVASNLEPAAGSLSVRVFRPMGTRFFAERFARYEGLLCCLRSRRQSVFALEQVDEEPVRVFLGKLLDLELELWLKPKITDRMRRSITLPTVGMQVN